MYLFVVLTSNILYILLKQILIIMLLTKEVKINVNNKSASHYRNLGYIFYKRDEEIYFGA